MPGKYTSHHAALPDKPGTNWVEKAGGLPAPIDAVARALVAKGWNESRAIATAVNHVKKVCATGRAFGGKVPVSAEARATACRAVASWEAKKAAARALSLPADERRVMELTFARIDGESVELAEDRAREFAEADLKAAVELAQERGCTVELKRVELAAPRPGLVQVEVDVRSRRGKTFKRRVWVRPGQARAMAQQKGGRKVTVKGLETDRATRGVLEQLAKLPKADRPAGWDTVVRAVAGGPTHGGRLGPAKRRALRELQRNAPDGSPLKAAVTAALKADARTPEKPKRRARAKRAGAKRATIERVM